MIWVELFVFSSMMGMGVGGWKLGHRRGFNEGFDAGAAAASRFARQRVER